MELIKLFSENEKGKPYYNPKFGYIAIEYGDDSKVAFIKILSHKVLNNGNISLKIGDTTVDSNDEEYPIMLLDPDWNFSDKIEIEKEIEDTHHYPHYDLDKYSWSKKAIEDYVSLLDDYKKYLNNSKFADFYGLSKYLDEF